MSDITPEMKAFAAEIAGLFADRVEKRIERAEESTTRHLDGMSRQIDGVSRQVVVLQNSVVEVQVELKEQSETLARHSTEIAVIQTRLEEGQKRFEKHEADIEELKKKPAPHPTGRANYKHIGGAVGVGAAIVAALSRLFGAAPKQPEKENHERPQTQIRTGVDSGEGGGKSER